MSQSLSTKIELALEQIRRAREDIKEGDARSEARFGKLEKKLDEQYPTRREIQEVEARVDKLEGNWIWLIRVVSGAFIATAISVFIAFKK